MRKGFKQLFLSITCLVLLLFTVASCNLIPDSPTKRDPATFDAFAQSIFELLLKGDELDCNFLFENPENFGLEHYEPSLPTPSKSSLIGSMLINLYFYPLKQYDFNELNADQQATYLVLADLITYVNNTINMSYLKNDYLGSYLGYQAQLPLLLTQYHLRGTLDIDNYFTYLRLMPETFAKYVDFEIEKADNGYGMPNYVIDKVIDQCEQFIAEVNNKQEEHFLHQTFINRLNNLDLDEETKQNYIETNLQLVLSSVVEAYQYVIDHLGEIYDKSVNDYGLCYYVDAKGEEIGKKYYELLFKHTTGFDDSIEDAIAYYDEKIEFFASQIRDIANSYPELYNEALNTIVTDKNPDELLEFYINNYTDYFPDLNLETLPMMEIRTIDKSMEDHYSPASYSVSAIDNFTEEFIHLNNKSILNSDGSYDYNYLYTTIAHEGFPGHMYQNIYFKNQGVNTLRKILKNGGYVEGWATYVEYFSYEFIKDELDPIIIDYLRYDDLLRGSIQARCDIGIHYEGWKESDVENYVGRYYKSYYPTSDKYVEGASTRLIQQLVEVPTNSQKYFYTVLKLIDMLNTYKETDNFDIVNYHQQILEFGPLPLKYIKEKLDAYYNVK